jgi:hypothetical protein
MYENGQIGYSYYPNAALNADFQVNPTAAKMGIPFQAAKVVLFGGSTRLR